MNAALKPRSSDTAAAASELALADSASVALPGVAVPVSMRLCVATGVQAGADIALAPDSELTIGGGRDDIRLRDHAVGDARISASVTDDGLIIRRLAGAVMAHDLPLGPGESTRVGVGDSIALGAVLLSIEASQQAAVTAAQPALAPPIDTADAPVSDATQQNAAAQPRAGRGIARTAAVVLVLAAAGVGYLMLESRKTPDALPTVAASSLLEDPRFSALTVDDEGGRVVIDGVLPDAKTLAALDTWLGANRVSGLNRVETDATLATKTLDVLRVNGADAQLVSSTGGKVSVTTALPADKDIEALVAMVRADVPALASLAVDNTPPPSSTSLVSDPGKRVAMVVSAPPAHIVTVDESRYFIGSVLPSGHRIEAIIDNRVTIVLGDERTVLDF